MQNSLSRKLKISLLFTSAAFLFLSCQKKQENKAEAFDKIASTLFKNVYFYLAKQIKEDYSVNKGICIDIGAGPGYLSIELAKITDLEIWALDIDTDALKIAQRNIKKANLPERIKTIQGDVQQMSFSDDIADLIISRGSFPFWKDKVKAFREIYRILKPGGVAFVGGGLGNLLPEEERTRVREIMDKEKIGPPEDLQLSIKEMGEIMRNTGIINYEITSDEGCLCGLWVEFRKPSPNLEVLK